jgi:cytochrome oxidase Cu insertion factor (SCO1/SenC/PrrC family)
MDRREFLIVTTGLISGAVLGPLIAKANQFMPENENLNALEEWLFTTVTPDFEPTISVLLAGNPMVVYLPFVSK